ncbi:hypothetical protein FF1_008357 [Malus domestica]
MKMDHDIIRPKVQNNSSRVARPDQTRVQTHWCGVAASQSHQKSRVLSPSSSSLSSKTKTQEFQRHRILNLQRN